MSAGRRLCQPPSGAIRTRTREAVVEPGGTAKGSNFCLQDLPWETEIRDEDDFERLMLDQPAA